jgi:hypothetical protein
VRDRRQEADRYLNDGRQSFGHRLQNARGSRDRYEDGQGLLVQLTGGRPEASALAIALVRKRRLRAPMRAATMLDGSATGPELGLPAQSQPECGSD